MDPLRVTVHFESPVMVRSEPLHLDGLLMALSGDSNIPLKVVDGVYAASIFSLFAIGKESFEIKARKTDVSLIGDAIKASDTKQKSIYTSQGKWKHNIVGETSIQVEYAEAFCLGEKNQLEEILLRLNYFGPCRKLGYGRVSSVHVGTCEKAMELWKTRAFPEEHVCVNSGEWVAIDTASKPPYWMKKGVEKSMVKPDFFAFVHPLQEQ